MKQRGNAGKAERAGAWLLTFVMLLSLVMVPAGKVEAAGDIELSVTTGIGQQLGDANNNAEIEIAKPSGYATIQSLLDAGFTKIQIDYKISGYTKGGSGTPGMQPYYAYGSDWTYYTGSVWKNIADGETGTVVLPLTGGNGKSDTLQRFGLQICNVSTVTLESVSAKLIAGDSAGGSGGGGTTDFGIERDYSSGLDITVSNQGEPSNDWSGFDIAFNNNSGSVICDWIVKLQVPSGAASAFKCWNATFLVDGDIIYMYPMQSGKNAVIQPGKLGADVPGGGFGGKYVDAGSIQVLGVYFNKGNTSSYDYSSGNTNDETGGGGNSGSSTTDTSTNKDLDVEYNYAKLLQESLYFYDANMCGKLEGKCGIGWRGNCHIYDANISTTINGVTYKIDASGGFHDAGDHVKFGLPQGYAASMLGMSYYQFPDAYEENGLTPHLQTITDYFCDYFKRCTVYNSAKKVVGFCYQVGEGNSDHGVWSAPETQTLNRPAYFATAANPATDEVSVAIAALAINYMNFKNVEDLQIAKDLFAFVQNNSKSCATEGASGFYDSASWQDDYALAASALWKATGDSSYKSIYDANKSGVNQYWVLDWANSGAMASMLAGDSATLASITDVCKGKPTIDSIFHCVSDWGSCRYSAAEQFTGLAYDKMTNSSKYTAWAASQMNYMIGDNPNKRCFIVGYNENSSKYPHHRAASRSNDAGQINQEHYTLLGALVGGPGSNGTYKDDQNDYHCNEVALDYNAGLVGAAAGLYHVYKNATSTYLSYAKETTTNFGTTLASEEELTAMGVTKYYGSSSSVAVESVVLDKELLTLQVGAEKTLTATVTPEGASIVSWKSSNTEVATVKNGVVTGIGAGEATITATAGGKSVVCQVTVTPLPVAVLNADALSVTGVTYGDNKAVGEVSIINSGDGIAGPVSAAFKSGINSDFSLITGQIEAIMPGDTRNITVLPKSNLAAGQYKDVLIVSYFDGKDMQELSIPVSLSINRRKITVKADDKTKTFGEKNPKLTYSVTSGSIVKGDSLDVTCNTTTTETSEVGSYDIIVNAGDNANYDITCEKGTLTISKKAITSIMFPTAGDIEETEMLEASILSGGDTLYGDFAWESPAVILERGIWDVNAVLTLSDDAKKNYSFDEVEGYDEENGTITQKVKVNVSRKGLPKITFPTAETIQIGQSLKDATFKGGSIEYGTFRWEDDAIVPDKVGEYSYNVVFEWSDEYKSKYGIVSGDSDEIKINKVEVVVKKLDNEEEAVPPELVKRTKNMIQIRAEADHEYSIDDGETWTNEVIGETITFESLKSFTAYTITARIKETETVSASEVSAGLTVYTLVSNPYVINISNLGDPNYVEALCKESGTSTIEYSDNTLTLKENFNYYDGSYTIIGKNSAITIQTSVDTRIILSDALMKMVKLEGNGNAGITISGEVNVTDTIYSDDITDIIISGNGTLNTSGIITEGTVTIEGGSLVIDASNTGAAAIEAENVVIKGGNVKATGGEGSPAISSSNNVTISDGDFTVAGGTGSAGMIADRVTIIGGNVTVTGGAGNTAGINADKVTITGGTVSVTGQGDQPAIKADSKDIRIEIIETNGTAYKEPDKENPKKLVESITVAISSATIVKGQTAAVSAVILPADAADKSVTWSSSNPSVATVSQSGIVTAVLEGKTDIIATAKDGSGKSGRIAVTVIDNGQGIGDKAVQATGMTVEADVKGAKNIPVKGIFKLAPKKKMDLNVIFLPEDAVEEELTFTSKNLKIAKVDENGIITAGKKAGKTTITVTSENGLKKTFTVQVMKKPIKKVKIKVSKKVVKVKKKIKLKAVLTPNKKQASNSVYWKSSNPKVAVVSASGVVKGIKKGKAKITAVATDGSGKKATVTIQVK